MDEQNRILAGLILNCRPEDLKAISMRGDGSLAVVAPNGMKFIFSPVELENARDSFGLLEASIASAPAASMSAASTSSTGGAGSAGGRPKAERVEAGKLSSPHTHVKNRRQESRL